MVFQTINKKLQRLFYSEQEIQSHEQMEKMMATPQNTKKTPSPLGNHKFPEESWSDFQVEQDGKQITLKTYRMSNDPKNIQNCKAIVVIFHPLNDHMNNCAHVADYLVKNCQISCVGFDYRGFGKSEGHPGYLENEEQHCNDCTKFLEIVEKTYPDKKIFLTGVSLGGLTSFLMGVRHPNRFAGTVLFAPAIKDQKLNQKYAKQMAKAVGYFFPLYPLIERKRDITNKNPQIKEDQLNDPHLYNGKVIPGTVRSMLNMMDKAHSQYEKFDVPFLIIQPGVDKLVCPTLSKELIDRSPAKDKQLLFYENLWHDVWMEDEVFEIMPEACQWINKRI